MSLFRAQLGDIKKREKGRKKKREERARGERKKAHKRRSTAWSKRTGFERLGKGVTKVPRGEKVTYRGSKKRQ